MASINEAPSMQTQAFRVVASSPALTGVPAEIFELIASHVDEAGLRSLRLTCHTSAANVMRTFAKAHFNSRTMLLCDQESIEDAIRAAKHPYFGRYLSDLAIYGDKVRATPAKSLDVPIPSYGSQATAEDANLEGCRQTLEHLFRIMQQRGVGLRLALLDNDAERNGWDFQLDSWRDQWATEFSPACINDTAPLNATMKAVFATKVKVHELAIHTTSYLPLCSWEELAPEAKFPPLDGLVAHVRRLDVCLFREKANVCPFDMRRGVRSLVDMITRAPHLRSLRLELWEYSMDRISSGLGAILDKGLPLLHRLSIDSAWLTMASVRHFIQRSPSLRILDLKSVDFIMRYSFNEDLLKDFEFKDGDDIHALVRKAVGLPGQYEDLWSDDVALWCE